MRRLHFVLGLLGVLLLINILSTAQIKVEVQGGKGKQAQQAAGSQPSNKLTNQDIIDMAALKLPDDVIIGKIHNTEAIEFDTSVAGLKQLKAKNVSDAVVRAMINPRPMKAETRDAAATKKTASLDVITEDGVYVVLAGKPIKLQLETFTMYVGRGKATGRVENPHSQLQVSNPLEFVVKSNFGAKAEASPGGAGQLFRLDEKDNHREFRLTPHAPHATVNWRGKVEVQKLNNQISFDREIIDSQMYRIRLPNLSKGEYGFQWVESHDFDQDGSMQQYHICTFSVID